MRSRTTAPMLFNSTFIFFSTLLVHLNFSDPTSTSCPTNLHRRLAVYSEGVLAVGEEVAESIFEDLESTASVRAVKISVFET